MWKHRAGKETAVVKCGANTETRSMVLQKYNFLHHSGFMWAWVCHFSPHLLNHCRNAAYLQQQKCGGVQDRAENSCNLFSAEALRVPGFSIVFNKAGNSFPKPSRAAAPAFAVAVPPPKGVVSEGNQLRKISWTPGPFLLLSSLLCFTAESTKTSSILILAFPT